MDTASYNKMMAMVNDTPRVDRIAHEAANPRVRRKIEWVNEDMIKCMASKEGKDQQPVTSVYDEILATIGREGAALISGKQSLKEQFQNMGYIETNGMQSTESPARSKDLYEAYSLLESIRRNNFKVMWPERVTAWLDKQKVTFSVSSKMIAELRWTCCICGTELAVVRPTTINVESETMRCTSGKCVAIYRAHWGKFVPESGIERIFVPHPTPYVEMQ